MGRTSTRRQEILDAATKMFAVRGYGSVSIADLAEALSTSKAAIYYHFNFKQELLATIVSPLLESVRDCVWGDQPTVEQLLGDYIDVLLAHREQLRILLGDVGAVMATDVGPIMWDNHERLMVRLRAGDDTTRSLTKASAVSGALHIIGGWSLRDQAASEIKGPLLESCMKVLA